MTNDSQPDAPPSFDQEAPERSAKSISNASYQRSWRKANRDKANAATAKYRKGSSNYKQYRSEYMQDYRKKSKANSTSDL